MIVLRVAPTTASHERFELSFFIEGATWAGIFDSLEVWRSRGTSQGPYEPLTDDSWSPARLPLNTAGDPPSPAQAGPSVPLVGQTLQFLVDERTPITVLFTGTDPLTFGQAATQIQAQSLGLLTAFALGSALIVQTVEPGAKAILRCAGGEAAPLLGLTASEPGSLAFGRDARIVLIRGEQDYGFVDPNGCEAYFYKARFFNSALRTVSQFSQPFQGLARPGLEVSSLCRGYVTLVDMSGEPAVNQEVLIYNKFNGTQAEAKTVAGGSQRLLTDKNGRAEILLVRGTLVTVAIGGTTLVRDVLIPTDPTVEAVDLLASANGTNDVFTVQIPNIPYAVRRSL